jgi:hypothetical protein
MACLFAHRSARREHCLIFLREILQWREKGPSRKPFFILWDQPFDIPRSRIRGLPFGPSSGRGLSLPAGRQGLILHFDKLSVLSLSMEAGRFTPFSRRGFGAVEVSIPLLFA